MTVNLTETQFNQNQRIVAMLLNRYARALGDSQSVNPDMNSKRYVCWFIDNEFGGEERESTTKMIFFFSGEDNPSGDKATGKKLAMGGKEG